MKFSNIRIAGREVNVIFTGKNYFFFNDFYGVIGIAERYSYNSEEDRRKFTIMAGTVDTVGGSINRCVIITAMKRFISKEESEALPHKTEYVVSEKICNHCLIVEAQEYK